MAVAERGREGGGMTDRRGIAGLSDVGFACLTRWCHECGSQVVCLCCPHPYIVGWHIMMAIGDAPIVRGCHACW